MRTFVTRIIMMLLLLLPAFGAQDDVELTLRNPAEQSPKADAFGVLGDALAQVDLGYYLAGDEYHQWRASVLGDLSLIQFSNRLHWHMGLAMETLADAQNDINFRLVQVYYRVLTGIKWHLSPSSVLHLGSRHRCSHGTDKATESRITIRSGLTASYAQIWQTKFFRFDIKPGINLYVLGQNDDLGSQPKGGSFLTVQALWPIVDQFSLILGSGINIEMVSKGRKAVYLAWDGIDGWELKPLLAARIGLRFTRNLINSDFTLAFRQNLDSSIGPRASRNNTVSIDVNLMW